MIKACYIRNFSPPCKKESKSYRQVYIANKFESI